MADQSNKVDLRHSLDRLYDVIASRKNESPEDSYTAQLFANAPANPARAAQDPGAIFAVRFTRRSRQLPNPVALC